MSITSRINEMSSHIEQAYDELQGLGADLTNVNKNIENISMVLDDIYDSMPQVSGEGTSLTLDDTRVGKIKSTLKGNTSQNGTPTPTSPIPINVVSGDNEINVVGKNLLPISTLATQTKNGITFTNNNNGSYTFNGTASAYTTFVLNNNLSFNGNYTYVMRDTATSGFVMYLQNSSGQGIGQATTHTTIDNSIGIMVIGINNGVSLNNVTIKPYVYKGAYDSTIEYEPYQGNTYNIDLPSGMELCKIGNYQDYFYKDSGKWYLHKEIGKLVLNGTQTLTYELALGVDMFKYTNNDMLKGNILDGYCNYYENQKNIGPNIYQDAEFRLGWNSKVIYFMNDTSRFNGSLQNFNNWLTSHNVITYYPLGTPTNTEITYQPLIDQLNELEKAISYDSQTNISQVNNDLPFIISASALKEWQESASLNSTLSMANPLSLENTLNTQENNTQPIEVDNIEPLEEEENE